METEIDYTALKKSDKCKRGFKLMHSLAKEKLNIYLYRAETLLELEEVKDQRFDTSHTATYYNSCLASYMNTDKMLAKITKMQKIVHNKLKKIISAKK